MASALGGLVGIDIAGLFQGFQSHPIDDERSAVLVAAPTVGGQYATDPAAYSAYNYFTSAHEGTFTDHSMYLNPSQPVPAGNHLLLALSRSKHATYSFNSDHYPLTPDWVIAATYATIDLLFALQEIDDFSYLIYSFIADTAFFSCFVEHFTDQGGWIASPRINVGELAAPLNACGFILDDRIAGKLRYLLWGVQ